MVRLKEEIDELIKTLMAMKIPLRKSKNSKNISRTYNFDLTRRVHKIKIP